MHELYTFQEPVASLDTKTNQEPFIRKPYKKSGNLKLAPIKTESQIESQEDRVFTLIDLSSKSTPILKQRPSIESKLSNLIDFGLVPDMPATSRDLLKLKQNKNQRINITDFISKSTQKQIISFHQLPDTKDYSDDKSDSNYLKRRVNQAFSFTGLSTLDTDSVRNSRTFQTLPPILPKDLERFTKFKTMDSREENLKKIDKIVGDCEHLLKNGKKSTWKLNNQISCMKYNGKREIKF